MLKNSTRQPIHGHPTQQTQTSGQPLREGASKIDSLLKAAAIYDIAEKTEVTAETIYAQTRDPIETGKRTAITLLQAIHNQAVHNPTLNYIPDSAGKAAAEIASNFVYKIGHNAEDAGKAAATAFLAAGGSSKSSKLATIALNKTLSEAGASPSEHLKGEGAAAKTLEQAATQQIHGRAALPPSQPSLFGASGKRAGPENTEPASKKPRINDTSFNLPDLTEKQIAGEPDINQTQGANTQRPASLQTPPSTQEVKMQEDQNTTEEPRTADLRALYQQSRRNPITEQHTAQTGPDATVSEATASPRSYPDTKSFCTIL